jgi:predicted ribosome quality control (RQC) complex YloA/Tae2 family protein
MWIRWDALLARHVARELDRSVTGDRLRALRLDRARREVTLLLKKRAVIWRLHPTRGDVRIHPPVEPVPSDHRVRATLSRVSSPPDERLIRFDFSPAASGALSVVVELVSTQWNAVVTEGESQIVRHLLWRPAKDDRRIIGQPYSLPTPTQRVGADGDVTADEWLRTLLPVSPEERPGVLVRSFAWTSPLNATALLGTSPEREDVDALVTGWQRWQELVDPDRAAQPVVLELASGPQPYPFPLAGLPSRPADSLLSAFADSEADGHESSPVAVLGPEVTEQLEGRVRRAARRTRRLEEELEQLPDADALRSIGDLILARYGEVPSEAERVTLRGFQGESVEVRLTPGEPAHVSAERYYHEAKKVERAAERLPRLVEESRSDLRSLEGLLERVRSGSALPEDVHAALGPSTPGRGGEPPGAALPYRSFRSSGGLEIRVGRGAKHNDRLTFKHSSPNDVWLHARHAGGAHVILRWPRAGRPPARDLAEAAALAALHSKARTSGSVPVDWTLRKYVRKPRKSPAGQVVIEREETLFVAPDPALLEELADRPGTGSDA